MDHGKFLIRIDRSQAWSIFSKLGTSFNYYQIPLIRWRIITLHVADILQILLAAQDKYGRRQSLTYIERTRLPCAIQFKSAFNCLSVAYEARIMKASNGS